MNLWDLVKAIVDLATPEIRQALCRALDGLEEKANQTPNPIDNILVYALKKIAGCQ